MPTYAPGERINGLLQSLENQTLPTSEFEVIFVDDGSPGEDTWTRLQQIRDTYDNVRIERIENSGWPSRPRNVGLEMARGQYVLFMDHDDELYPRALEAGYEMAARTGADVLSGKETRTDQSKWALQVFTENMDNSIDRTDVHPLLHTNPHKLFRRQMLLDHHIRFPEGRRVLWEDVFFNLDVAQHAHVISVLSDVPFYHWVRGRETASSSYLTDLRSYWAGVRDIVVRTNERLGGPGFERQWLLMMRFQYITRVLAAVGPALFEKSEEDQRFVQDIAQEIVREHIPADMDEILTPTQLARAILLRNGQWELLKKFVAVDRGVTGLTRSTAVQWREGALVIKGESRWHVGTSDQIALRVENGRVLRDLPADVVAALPRGAVDVTEALSQATSGMAIRSRANAVTWMLPSVQNVRVDTTGGLAEVVVTVAATLDPESAGWGHFHDDATWDIHARNELFGATNQRGLRTSTAPRVALKNGHVYIAYTNKTGMLSIDIDERARSLAGSAPLDVTRLTTEPVRSTKAQRLPTVRESATLRFLAPFTAAVAVDTTTVEGSARLGTGERTPARLVPRDGEVWLETSLTPLPGIHPLYVNFFGRDIKTNAVASVDIDGTTQVSSS